MKSGQRIFVGATLLFEQMRILSGGLSRTIILERKVADEFEGKALSNALRETDTEVTSLFETLNDSSKVASSH